LVADAERLAQASKVLSERFVQTETDFAEEWSAINALDLVTSAVPGDVEKRANQAFGQSIDELRKASAR